MTSPYNMHSPTSISEKCEIGDLDAWLQREVSVLDREERAVIDLIVPNILTMVRFAERAHVLWPGCNRVPPAGERQRIHRYPEPLKSELKALAGVEERERRADRPNPEKTESEDP